MYIDILTHSKYSLYDSPVSFTHILRPKLATVTGILLLLFLVIITTYAQAREMRDIEMDDTSIEVRVFSATGDTLLLGFPLDEGKSVIEEHTAASLAEDGIEVWMPDLLSAYMLPNVRSSLTDIPVEAILKLIDEGIATGKKVYLIASGPNTELILRGASQWEAIHKSSLPGAIMLFPRLFKHSPDPGVAPEYIDSVGTTRLPLMLLEGERTPNQWGINKLVHALQKNGSPVYAKLIPSIRGKFFTRKDPNRSEAVVASQLAGLIKVSLYYLRRSTQHD